MATASLLPMARAVFYDANGNPLAGGFVNTYVPGGTTPKTTWQDAAEVTPNSNPIVLDSAGSCLLYGSGTYQLTVTNSLGAAVPGYSGVAQATASNASDLTYTPPWISSTPRPISGRLADYMSAADFGVVGDGVTDTTVALQAAINAAEANQVPLFIPAGRYLISSALTITRGCRIFGAYVEPEITIFLPTPNPGGNGTWILINSGTLISAFFINPTGTPSANNQVEGVEISHIAFLHAQPSPSPGFTPNAYPPVIDIPAGSDVNIHDVFMMNPTVAIRAAGQSAGRLTIERVAGQPLSQGIVLDNQTDTVVVRDIHFWTYWSLDTNVLTYQKANGVGLQLGRIDNPIFDNFFCLWYWIGCQITATANGTATAVRLTNSDFDLCYNPLVISSGTNNTVFVTGCLLGGPTPYLGTSGIAINGGTGNLVYVSACVIEGFGNSCVSNSVAGGNHVRITASQLFQWAQLNAGFPCLQSAHTNTIRMDASCQTFSTVNNTGVLAGGQCLKTPGFFLTHGTMPAASTSVVLPHLLDVVPDMMLVTPNGGPSAATEWWATADASNVTVQVNIAPGGNVNFSVLLGVAN